MYCGHKVLEVNIQRYYLLVFLREGFETYPLNLNPIPGDLVKDYLRSSKFGIVISTSDINFVTVLWTK